MHKARGNEKSLQGFFSLALFTGSQIWLVLLAGNEKMYLIILKK